VHGATPDRKRGAAAALPQYLEAAAAVAGACDDDFGVDRNAPFLLDRRDELRGVRMSGDGEAKLRRADRRQLMPDGAGILRPEDAVVMLAPHDFGTGGAARQPVDVLGDRLFMLLGRHVLCVHTAVDIAR
jgi:hypothetical protein